jgi:phosphoglycolate phosphatase
VIFDFDGTIVRSHELVYATLKQLLKNRVENFPSADELREMSSQESLIRLGINFWEVPVLLWRARKIIRKRQKDFEMSVVPGLRELLSDIKISGIQLSLLTSNSLPVVARSLGDSLLLFDHVHCSVGFFSKARKLKSISQNSKTVYVCDESRDIVASQKAGVKSIAVAWGFHSARVLQKAGASHMVVTVGELQALLRKNSN